VSETSTKPYLIRAIHEWCSDNGYTPYLAVAVDERTQVPMEYVKAGEIVLNVSLGATNRLALGNELISFQARFGGVAREISVPIDSISAIYARENGHGMAFEVPKAMAHPEADTNAPSSTTTGALAGSPFSLVTSGAPEAASLAATPGFTQATEQGIGQDAAESSAQISSDKTTGAGAVPPPDDAPSGGGQKSGRPHLTRVK
jgi:stringent starvation protein B